MTKFAPLRLPFATLAIVLAYLITSVAASSTPTRSPAPRPNSSTPSVGTDNSNLTPEQKRKATKAKSNRDYYYNKRPAPGEEQKVSKAKRNHEYYLRRLSQYKAYKSIPSPQRTTEQHDFIQHIDNREQRRLQARKESRRALKAKAKDDKTEANRPKRAPKIDKPTKDNTREPAAAPVQIPQPPSPPPSQRTHTYSAKALADANQVAIGAVGHFRPQHFHTSSGDTASGSNQHTPPHSPKPSSPLFVLPSDWDWDQP